MSEMPARTVVIVGGGTAGWMTAAALSRFLERDHRIVLIESEAIGTVGVGEATIPQIQLFNQALGLDEAEFLSATQASYKLGIVFDGWSRPGERYIHGFGQIGRALGVVPFHHYWLRARAMGAAGPLGDYGLNAVAAFAGRMAAGAKVGATLGGMPYAFHFDAGLYAAHLRRYAESRGVVRLEGLVVDADLVGRTGHIGAVHLADGRGIAGDLFIDCSGFGGLLIEQKLHAGYETWTQWLPCDRAVAVPCAHGDGGLAPYTRATARSAGWQWRIPLQHRIGNGYVFSSACLSDDAATTSLLAHLDGPVSGEPRLLRFTTGRRKRAWVGNCIALGLAGGFLEPLESTSIHLIQSGIQRLLEFWPGADIASADVDAYNRATAFEFERIRDFLILHYWANGRLGEPLWDNCRAMALPDTLVEKLDLFRATGRIVRVNEELFTEPGWFQVLVGQGIQPRGWHGLADQLTAAELAEFLRLVQAAIAQDVEAMPTHAQFIAQHIANRPREPRL